MNVQIYTDLDLRTIPRFDPSPSCMNLCALFPNGDDDVAIEFIDNRQNYYHPPFLDLTSLYEWTDDWLTRQITDYFEHHHQYNDHIHIWVKKKTNNFKAFTGVTTYSIVCAAVGWTASRWPEPKEPLLEPVYPTLSQEIAKLVE